MDFVLSLPNPPSGTIQTNLICYKLLTLSPACNSFPRYGRISAALTRAPDCSKLPRAA